MSAPKPAIDPTRKLFIDLIKNPQRVEGARTYIIPPWPLNSAEKMMLKMKDISIWGVSGYK